MSARNVKKKAETVAKTATVEAKAAPVVETPVSEAPAAEKKAAPKRACKKVSMELQFNGKSIDAASLEGLAVADWMEKTQNAKVAAKNINLYVKPEESALYYVIEGTDGKVEL